VTMPDAHLRCIEAWLRDRDEAAARELMNALHPQIVRIVQRHLPFRMAAEDLVQEVFVKFFRNVHRYEPRRPLENWVSRLALNVCRDHLRARACRPELRWADLSEGERHALDTTLHAEEHGDSAHASDARTLTRKLLETLSADDRMVLTLLHLEEKSVDEIVALTGWNRTLVKVRAFRARARMRKALEAIGR
jgi:RNA polymerase sigma-70 factor (ECF subfamily)